MHVKNPYYAPHGRFVELAEEAVMGALVAAARLAKGDKPLAWLSCCAHKKALPRA